MNDYTSFFSHETNALLNMIIAGNTVYEWGFALVTFLLIYVALYIFRSVLLKKVSALTKKTSLKFDDAVLDVLNNIGIGFYTVIALYAAVKQISVPPIVTVITEAAFLIVIVNEVIKLAERIIHFALMRRLGSQKKAEEERGVSAFISVVIKIGLWSIGLLLILSNLGFNVNSLIAGLGVGGLAISLALQNILGDLFSSFSIAMDKPFEEGDFIVVGEHKGTVKKIGLKTTRIEALQGEEIVISNNELTTARVQNFKKMQKRRISFFVTATYDTPTDKLRKIPEIVREAIEAQEHVQFDRAHFATMGDSSLNFEVVYFMTTSDYTAYMNTQQDINLRILDAFKKEGIDIPFPTQTVYVAK